MLFQRGSRMISNAIAKGDGRVASGEERRSPRVSELPRATHPYLIRQNSNYLNRRGRRGARWTADAAKLALKAVERRRAHRTKPGAPFANSRWRVRSALRARVADLRRHAAELLEVLAEHLGQLLRLRIVRGGLGPGAARVEDLGRDVRH